MTEVAALQEPAPGSTQPSRREPKGLNAWVLGREHKRRMRVQRSMLSMLIYVAWMVLEVYAARTGLISYRSLWIMVSYNVVGLVAFYVLLRGGLSDQMRDPNLALEQMCYAVGAILIAYVLVPQTRAAALQVLCLIPVFGMFTLRPREMRLVGWLSSASLMATALGMWALDAAHFTFARQGINAVMACVVIAACVFILGHFCQLREDLRAQTEALRETSRRVEELATHDALTGLFNRRHMQQLIQKELVRQTRSGAPLCLALLDLDHFKRVNDTHGHQVGDEVLCGVARLIAERLRGSDVVARWGGEEFLLMLPDTSAEAALVVVDRVREALSHEVISASAPALRATFSAGLVAHQPGGDPNDALAHADQALYAAKEAGRNRCLMGQVRHESHAVAVQV